MTRTKRKKQLVHGALAVLLSIGIVIALAEAGLRVADRMGWVSYWDEIRVARAASIWIEAAEPGLVYAHRPGYVKDRTRYTEASGILRPEDVRIAKPRGTLRVAVVGDSVSAALGLDYADRFPARLERMLRGDGLTVEVLNFGVNGYSSEQEAALLEHRVARFSPDAVVLQYCANDFRPSEYPWSWYRDTPWSYTVAYVLFRIERRNHIGYPPVAYWERAYREDSAGWASVRRAFARVAGWSERRSVPVILLLAPVLSHEGWLAGAASERHARVAEAGRQAGFEVVDLLPVMADHPVERFRTDPWDTFHFNAAGHRVIAQALAEPVRRALERNGGTDGDAAAEGSS